MRSNLEVLQIIKKSCEDENYHEFKSGLCGALRHLEYHGKITCVEHADIYQYLKRRYEPKSKSAFWWPPYDWDIRYEAICECIEEETRLEATRYVRTLTGHWNIEEDESDLKNL